MAKDRGFKKAMMMSRTSSGAPIVSGATSGCGCHAVGGAENMVRECVPTQRSVVDGTLRTVGSSSSFTHGKSYLYIKKTTPVFIVFII